MKTHRKLLIILLAILAVSAFFECLFSKRNCIPASGANPKGIVSQEAANEAVWVVVEPGEARMKLSPNCISNLKMMDGDTFSVRDVSVKGSGAERKFQFTLGYKVGEKEGGLSDEVRFSELPKKYFQSGKWTVWIKREGQLK